MYDVGTMHNNKVLVLSQKKIEPTPPCFDARAEPVDGYYAYSSGMDQRIYREYRKTTETDRNDEDDMASDFISTIGEGLLSSDQKISSTELTVGGIPRFKKIPQSLPSIWESRDENPASSQSRKSRALVPKTPSPWKVLMEPRCPV